VYILPRAGLETFAQDGFDESSRRAVGNNRRNNRGRTTNTVGIYQRLP
jgi:hypothetical protein